MALRLGVVDAGSSHTAEFLRHAGARVDVVARVGPGVDDVAGLARAVASGEMDAVAVFVRDGRRHGRIAEPLLAAGARVFLDKPLACGVADAGAILAAAGAGGGAVASCSAVPFLPAAAACRAAAEAALARGEVARLWARGPADPDSPHGGAWFYGIHTAELVAWAWDGVAPWEVSADLESAHAVARSAGGVEVAAHLVDHPDAPFTVGWAGRDGRRHEAEVPVGPGYYAPVTEQILEYLDGGAPPADAAQTLRPVALTEVLVTAWARARRG